MMNFGIRRRNRCPPAPIKRITYTKPFVRNFITNVKRKLVFDQYESSLIVEHYGSDNSSRVTSGGFTLPESVVSTPGLKEDLDKSMVFDDVCTVEEKRTISAARMDEEYESLDKVLSSFNISGSECKKDK